jgi:WhiB family redox-sensing transcriptional regulator
MSGISVPSRFSSAGRTGQVARRDWAARGACRGVDPESLFVVGAAQNKAKSICTGCPVRIDCLADALDSRAEFGVWGGMTERERRNLLRRHPEIESWHDVLASQHATAPESPRRPATV